MDATGKSIAVAHYADGIVATVRLDENESPRAMATFLQKSGKRPHPRQDESHARGVYFDRANRFLFVPDLDRDRIDVYAFNVWYSKFKPTENDLSTAPGASPRHMAFSPDEKHVYVINELDNTLLAAAYDGNGNFTLIGTVPTMPEGNT